MAKIRLGYDVIVVHELDGIEAAAVVGKVIGETPKGYSVAVVGAPQREPGEEYPSHEDGIVLVMHGLRDSSDTVCPGRGECTYLRMCGEHYDILDDREAAARAAAAEQPAGDPDKTANIDNNLG